MMSSHDRSQAAAAAGKETFWKRSRRTLGDKYFAFLKESAGPSLAATTNVTGNEPNDSSSDPHSQAYARRREQIRRSQRTHRARTEKYVIGLEEEVGRLRLAHADCVALVKSLQRQLSQSTPQTERFGTAADINVLGRVEGFTEGVSGVLDQNLEVSRDSHHPGGFPNAQSATNLILDSKIGLEFVIRLEEPCLNHVRRELAASQTYPASNFSTPTPLSSRTALSRIAPEDTELTSTPDSTTAERLLALSSRLDLDDDQITPIQAWESIKSHPKAHVLTAETIKDLRERSHSLLTCHRHGAALNKSGFEALLEEILSKSLPSV